MNIIGVATISICFSTLLVGSVRADAPEDIIQPEVVVKAPIPPFQRQEDDYLPVVKIAWAACPFTEQERQVAWSNFLVRLASEHPELSQNCEKSPVRLSRLSRAEEDGCRASLSCGKEVDGMIVFGGTFSGLVEAGTLKIREISERAW